MQKIKPEIDYFALLIENWTSFYSFGINSMNTKLKSDMDYEFYDRTKSLELICKTYQDELSGKLDKNKTVLVHLFPRNDKRLKEESYKCIGSLELSKTYNKVYINIPEKEFNYLISILSSKQNNAISITHTEIKRNKALILSYDIMTDFNPDEF